MSTATTTTTATALQSRARRLRSQAASLHPLLAQAYQRRAAELDLQAWLEAVWNPPIDLRDSLYADGSEPIAASDRPLHSAVA